MKHWIAMLATSYLMGVALFSTTLGSTSSAWASLPLADVRTLEAGTYFAQGSMYSRSYRVVARRSDRLCVKIVNGPPNPYEGYQMITVSTISSQKGQNQVAATQDGFTMKGPRAFVIGSGGLGNWQLAPNFDRDLSEGLKDCLNAQGRYGKTVRGPFITGMIYPNALGQLTAKDAVSQIDVRQEPEQESKILHYGMSGDRVILMTSSRDHAGNMWYEVKSETSNATGWVQKDFVRRLK